MINFRKQIECLGRHRGIAKIIKALDSSIVQGDLYKALAYLNELEIAAADSHPDYCEYEAEIARAFARHTTGEEFTGTFLASEAGMSQGIRGYKNIHQGERCSILGRGASLDAQNLSPLANEITFSMNLLCQDLTRLGFEPAYYVSEDELLLEQYHQHFAKLAKASVFLPYHARHHLEPAANHIYVNTISHNGVYFDFPFFGTDASRRIWSAGSATYMALQLAYYMGFSEVYLLGIDHHYTMPESAVVSDDNIVTCTGDPNHCAAARFAAGTTWRKPQPDRLEAAYTKAAYAYSRSNRKIINCTPRSRLRIFPLRSLTSVLSSGQPGKRPGPSKLQPEITVVVPCYNSELTIDRCLESLCSQCCDPEILIINDGSTDSTLQKVSAWAGSKANIRIISQSNQGLGSARNTGIINALAPYITFVDSDDTLEYGILEQALARQRQQGADILQFGMSRVIDGRITESTSLYADFAGLHALRQMVYSYPLSACARIYSTSLLQRERLFFPGRRLHEDLLFTLKAYYYAKNTAYLPINGYNWIARSGSIISEVKPAHLLSMMDNIDDFQDFLINVDLLYSHYDLLIEFIFRTFMMVYLRGRRDLRLMGSDEWQCLLDKFIAKYNLDWYEFIDLMENRYPNSIKKYLSGLFNVYYDYE